MKQRRFAPRGLCTLTGCGKPWTASKSSKDEPAHRFPPALGKPANGRRFPTARTRPLRIPSIHNDCPGEVKESGLNRRVERSYRRFAPTA